MANGTVEHGVQPRARRPALPTAPPRRTTASNGTHHAGNGAASSVDERKLLDVLTALRKGDFSPRLRVKWTGDGARIADTVNELMDVHQRFVRELERLSRVVGREGRIGHRAAVYGLSGSWSMALDAVNTLVGDLVAPTSEMARVIGAVARGDLTQTMALDLDGRPLQGEFLRTARTVNRMVEQLGGVASEVTRIVREVGTEGKLGGQARAEGVAGTWKDLTESVNFMAGNLSAQVRNIAEVTTAVASGDLSKKITVDVRGEILELKNTINTMVDQLRSFASEVTRVAREVGSEGKLGGQADVKGVAGTWKDLTDSVNSMAANLTAQVRNIADVTTAVATGDLSKKITVDVKGEILELKNTVNTMVDQLRSFADEVTRVAREVGTEGKLGGQADVRGVAGTWKDLTDSVNSMASNLTAQVRNIAEVTTAVANGDLSKKITVHVKGEILELKDTINTMVDQLRSFASEVTRVAREVGTEGKLGGQADVPGVAGTWKDLTDSVNFMAGNLTAQVRNIAEVTKAVASGDLSKKITVDVKGEISELKNTINTMVDQLSSFASEVTRVAREVGTEGKLGGQAYVKGVSGTWKDLTDNVNLMAANLTNQVRGIAKVVTAVANGDLERKFTVEAKGEIAALADTINSMIDTLATFADQVTTVAREVGVEGKLGGQASVPGAAGTWKHLTDNVNQLAANLTTQVRAIAEVATAVTTGDLTRRITVEAKGEVAALKDNINEMIVNLKETTQKNSEQDWLKTNLAKFSRMLQGQKDMLTVACLILSELAPVVAAQHGVFFVVDTTREEPCLRLLASYAYRARKNVGSEFKMGEGLVGQAAVEKEKILLTNVPPDYIQITSGLGEAPPLNILVLPVVFEGAVKAVIELASFDRFSATHQAFLDQLMESVGIVLNTIEANTRTEDLLKQSQSLATELQVRQHELQRSNAELEEKAKLLADQNVEVERKNREVEQARQALEEKASQLALTSKYKSEFLANMSHELRTPLNSLLILAEQLAANVDGNLSMRQVDYAKTIHGSGNDLLKLINDILDLAKIESGTVAIDLSDVLVADLELYVERTFRPVAESKNLSFTIELDPRTPVAIHTDLKRLQQILRNLLSNGFKFTDRGGVTLRVGVASEGWNPESELLNRAATVVAFSVTDTGIGIPPDKQHIIFEAFQQADGSTSRRYGGTGLGLAISREIARVLGGEIAVVSTPGVGSTFKLYLPQSTAAVARSVTRARVARELPPPEPPMAVELALPADDAVADDRLDIRPNDRVLVIVEDDPAFARVLLESAHARGFKGIVATRGAAGIALAQEYMPHAITLDVRLPDVSGWRLLSQLKGDLATRHIPIHIVSVQDDLDYGLVHGALGVASKPLSSEDVGGVIDRLADCVARPVKNLLLVEDDRLQREHLVELIGNGDVHTTAVGTGAEALQRSREERFDCVVVDLGLPDMDGIELIEQLRRESVRRDGPIVVYTARDLLAHDEERLQRLAQSIITKDPTAHERLFDATALYLHRAAVKMSESKRRMLERLHDRDALLAGKKILIVDDDIRNIYAMTSMLERHRMVVVPAENGREAIAALHGTPGIDGVLMDIMLPEMDGYETIRRIRGNAGFRNLPIIAVTAKAMRGDREKCIEAGASDYLAKPVDREQLLALLRLWLCR